MMMRLTVGKSLLGPVAMIAVSVSVWGCALFSSSADDRFASVEISGHSQKEISDAAVAVFAKAGYMSTGMEGELLFERDGPEWMQVAYGSNIADRAPVQDRVKAQIIDLGNGTFRLQCTAYAVPTLSGSMEKEMRLLITRSGSYRDLLKQVAASLSPLEKPAS